MNFEEMNENQIFLYMLSMQLALKFKKIGFNEELFLDFCKGLWETVEKNDIKELEDVLHEEMKKEMSDFKKAQHT